LIKIINFQFLIFSFVFVFFNNNSYANFEEKLINKYKKINTLTFDFKQKIGEKIEFGSCQIKYPLLMKCNYPKKNKTIIANGKRFVIIKKKYKRIYKYPLEKTPLFYLLQKKIILDIIKNYKPSNIEPNLVEYNIIENDINKLKVFFDKNKLELSGWKTTDSYSNDVIFLIRNIETNLPLENKIFKIPKEEDL
tara:strand:- start:385 stop:963 length:579 start_codon:yes stop_codon:yes gene_type:complete